MIPLAIPNIDNNPDSLEHEYLAKCINDQFVSTVGGFVIRFEEEIAELSGTKTAAAMATGTHALQMGLCSLDIGINDLVLVPSFTFIASANAISHTGAMPWFIDIENSSWTMDPAKLRQALKSETESRNGILRHKATGKRVAAIMPVYTLGTPANLDEICALAKEYDLPVIADAAAAIGVDYKGAKIGGLTELTAYSFNGNKTITSGGGGMLVGREDLIKRAKHLSTTARVSPNYDHDVIGYNCRMTNIEAAVGCAQLTKLEDFIVAKRRIRKAYDQAFETHADVAQFPNPQDRDSTCWFSGLVLREGYPKSVNEICALLKDKGIEARPFWRPVHMQKPYLGAPSEDMTVTENLWERIITLPCSTSLTEDEQGTVIDALTKILNT